MIEISSGRSSDDARGLTEEIFAQGLENGDVLDAVLASNLSQQKLFWHMRDDLSLSQRPEGASIAHDISVPLAKIPELIKRGEKLVTAIVPEARMMAFGHLGDGNIHYNFSKPVGMADADYLEFREEVNQTVYDLVIELGGSISAEHGIGLFKRDNLAENQKSQLKWK